MKVYTSEKIKELTLEMGGDYNWDNMRWVCVGDLINYLSRFSKIEKTGGQGTLRNRPKRIFYLEMLLEELKRNDDKVLEEDKKTFVGMLEKVFNGDFK
jgi:hypothetical protein